MSSKNEIVIYTDGACSGNPGPGGWGAVLLWEGKEKEVSGFEPDTTNNRMELTAVIESIRTLKRKDLPVRIVTDSEYVHNAFTQGWIKSWIRNGWKRKGNKEVKNSDLWKELVSLTESLEVHWEWTRGHAGDDLNERVDELARQAIERG